MSEIISRLDGRPSRVEASEGFIILCPRHGKIERALIFGKERGSPYRCSERVKWPNGTLPEGPCCRQVTVSSSEAANSGRVS